MRSLPICGRKTTGICNKRQMMLFDGLRLLAECVNAAHFFCGRIEKEETLVKASSFVLRGPGIPLYV